MTSGDNRLRVRILRSISDVSADSWDACANPSAAAQGADEFNATNEVSPFNPFVSHDFLLACELSGSATARTGWAGSHIVVEDAGGSVAAVAPCYLKTHSMGEYVFDWSWAEAFERVGARYYPKLQVCVPFTPVAGRRLLVAPGPGAPGAFAALVEGLRHLREARRASSTHVTFATPKEVEALEGGGFLRRTGRQFHFFNRGYSGFDDFLASLASRKRKMVRREREQALAGGLDVRPLTGAAIKEEHWDAFFEFYMDTGARKWGHPYLTRNFFSLVGERMSERILLVMARRNGRWIAGALNFIGGDALFGRNWGCIEEAPFLHFEVCYYQAIEFALSRGLARVEAGAQGEHKLARGYEPVETYSAHEFADRRLESAVAAFLRQEREQNRLALDVYSDHAPFRKG